MPHDSAEQRSADPLAAHRIPDAPAAVAVDGSSYTRERTDDHAHARDLERPTEPAPLGVPIYDNHTHLEIRDGEAFGWSEALDAAGRAGVAGVIQVGGDVETSRWSASLAAADARVLAAVALHPNEAPGYAEADTLFDALATIDALAEQPRVRAIGETGLDFFRTGEDGRRAQFESFEAHIDIAKRHGLALQIHDRDAHDDVVETLLRVGAPEKTVFHCFSGDEALARTAAEHGWYLSYSGTVTFKNARNLHAALAVTPLELVMVETDAPFLTPTPFRGRPNSPYMIGYTVRGMAEQLGIEADELAARTAETTIAVYGEWAS